MLYIIGLGLGDERDITMRGLEAVKKSEIVIRSLLSFGLSSDGLSNLRDGGEKAGSKIEKAIDNDIAFLVVGDPFELQTHSDLVVRAKKLGVNVEVGHNASLMNAVGICGLQLYHYGETVSIPFFTETWSCGMLEFTITELLRRDVGVLQIRNCKLKDHRTEEGSKGRHERSRCLSE